MTTVVTLSATYLLYVVALGALLSWLRAPRADRLPFAVAGVVAAVAVGILVKVAGAVWTDPRPFVVDHVAPLINHGVDNGFPSDHTALAVAVSLVVLTRDRLIGGVLLVLSLALGAARVAALVHHVPDIAVGGLIGAVAAYAGVLAARHVPARLRSRQAA
jgi:undecaprenyl-diphosphatase